MVVTISFGGFVTDQVLFYIYIYIYIYFFKKNQRPVTLGL